MRRALAIVAFCLLPTAGAAEDDYHPLAVGQRRAAVVEMTDVGGKTTRGRVVREVVGTEEIGGRTYFKETVTFTGVPGLDKSTAYRRKGAGGVYLVRAEDPDRTELLDLPLPPKVGSEWTMETKEGKINYRLEAKASVEVGGKKYEGCLRISYRVVGTEIKATYFLAPGRGNVLEEIETPGGKMRIALESFEVKNSK